MSLVVKALKEQALIEVLPHLARLRMEVFRDYPYLYDGTPGYEEKYLTGLTESKDSVVVAALDDGKIAGCATGAALSRHHDEFARPFIDKGFAIDEIFYCGESVLLRDYRGRGLGHSFFNEREAHARRLGYRYSTFCGVIRPKDHPLRPADYRPLDEFWAKRGYEKVEGVTASFRWKEIDRPEETEHMMQFWMRKLD